MPDVRKCAIYGCRSNSRDCKGLKFFNFPPRDSHLYDTWLTICHESRHILTQIKRPYICCNHFLPKDVGFRRLAMGALPALKLTAPPGFAEEEKAREAAEMAVQEEKKYFINLINDSLLEWAKRAQRHSEFGDSICTTRRELQRVGTEIRNLLGATLTVATDDYWLRKFRVSHLQNWHDVIADSDQQVTQSLDLVEIIQSINPNAVISSEEEIAILVEEEEKIAARNLAKRNANKPQLPQPEPPKCLPLKFRPIAPAIKNPAYDGLVEAKSRKSDSVDRDKKKRSFKETLEEWYGINSNDSGVKVKRDKLESIDLSLDDEGCFDDNSECSHDQPVVVSEPIIDSYRQALEHLKPLEDFVLRQENYRAIGLLSTLEMIFKGTTT